MDFSGRRVLVLEDEYFIAQDVTDTLRGAGAIVLGPFATGADALQAIDDDPPDLGVLDLNLRGQVNFAVAERLRQLQIPFVFATGYEVSVIPPALRDVPVWKKPFETAELVTQLAAIEPRGSPESRRKADSPGKT